ncbi:MAG: 2-amino-4-hydroxy-6-hydroxymethyldihydropteridine diphosphokinase [Bacteroidetes bacterium]|nr:2-amino-4-hydroxy-6-hydroxymethyldihydropteridine diphosphokinase [Bacteroidota bacterium]
MEQHSLYLLLGSNLGDRKSQLDRSADLIAEMIGPVVMRSSLYETEPWGFASDDLFLNAALQCRTSLSPEEVMQRIERIEKLFGRERPGTGYSSRIIDIDILFYDGIVVDQEGLKIPHPRLPERRFVLVPLDEIAHSFVHPLSGKTIGDILRDCTDLKEVRKIER